MDAPETYNLPTAQNRRDEPKSLTTPSARRVCRPTARHLLFSAQMMNRIDEKFAALKGENRSAFIVYITGGDPSLEKTIEIAATLERAGTDILEIGVPFSDPLADGIANQLGAQRALQAGATLPKLLYTISLIRSKISLPIVLYSYLNPIFQYGFEQFEEDALAAGVDGLLLLDLPPEEALDSTQAHRIHRIRLIAPTTPEERIQSITGRASGFVYYVSREGVTGERDELASSIPEHLGQIRKHTTLPVVVGFGISSPGQAAQVAAWADGVVVGSAIVRKIGELGNDPGLSQKLLDFVTPIADAVHSVAKGT
jgi:tryptophan synthase alpha chain